MSREREREERQETKCFMLVHHHYFLFVNKDVFVPSALQVTRLEERGRQISSRPWWAEIARWKVNCRMTKSHTDVILLFKRIAIFLRCMGGSAPRTKEGALPVSIELCLYIVLLAGLQRDTTHRCSEWVDLKWIRRKRGYSERKILTAYFWKIPMRVRACCR